MARMRSPRHSSGSRGHARARRVPWKRARQPSERAWRRPGEKGEGQSSARTATLVALGVDYVAILVFLGASNGGHGELQDLQLLAVDERRQRHVGRNGRSQSLPRSGDEVVNGPKAARLPNRDVWRVDVMRPRGECGERASKRKRRGGLRRDHDESSIELRSRRPRKTACERRRRREQTKTEQTKTEQTKTEQTETEQTKTANDSKNGRTVRPQEKSARPNFFARFCT